ncbi:MAG: glycosyltransferase family 2 protein [Defluviitaleaceae bacterium]|nr:glycosyltransferase family 2 protein [Defluviitaleaceae bacterium]
MITVSLCMIVKNEEAVLARCLDSIKDAADEIIITDTGSTDSTKKIARKYTEKIFDFEWTNDFSAARNEAFSKATCDYQMWLDADDVVPPETLAKLLALKKTLDPAVDIVTMKYLTHTDADGNPLLYSTRERLLRRGKNFTWQDPVHECIALAGNILNTDMEIHHKKTKAGDPHRNLKIYQALEKSGKPFTPRQHYYYARELKDNGLWIPAAYRFEKFLDTKEGWSEDNIAACYNLALCYDVLGDRHKIFPILLKSFEYDSPRAEICCEIGYHYKREKNYAAALNWFRLAASLEKPDTLGFILQEYWGYIPNIEASICCWHLNDIEQARAFNERAAEIKPNSPAVKHNRDFFGTLNA